MPEVEFQFEFNAGDQTGTLYAPVTIPLTEQSVPELSARLMAAHGLPCFVQQG